MNAEKPKPLSPAPGYQWAPCARCLGFGEDKGLKCRPCRGRGWTLRPLRSGRIELVPNPPRDKALVRLADELGFGTPNVMVRFIANEISHCPKGAFFKALGQFSRFTRRT